MNAAFFTALAGHGTTLITHIGLVNGSGVELSGGGYARQTVSWTGAAGVRSPSANRLFSVASGAVVAGWRGYSALNAGTDYDGATLPSTTFTNAGTYTLLAASTNFTVQQG